MTRLTRRRLEAMDAALSAMLAGMVGEGDWSDDVPEEDMETAHSWVLEQLRKREKK